MSLGRSRYQEQPGGDTMRAFVLRSLAFALGSFAVSLSGRAFAQADSTPSTNATTAVEQPEEVTVRGRRTLPQVRLELERARNEMFRIFNEANQGTDTDVRCGVEQPTGTRMRHTVCRTAAEVEATSRAARDMLNSLVYSTSGHVGTAGSQAAPTPTPVNISSVASQLEGSLGAKDALGQFEDEWKRIFGENRDLFRAVTTYVELQQEYVQARGDTLAPGEQELAVLLEEEPVRAETNGPICEASTLTEYSQRNNLALVSGSVGISGCPAGTTGGFTVVARVRNDAGDVTPIEFNETWQRADTQDHAFEAQYPIGDNVFLQSVRVRNLTCTCSDSAQ
jgi:hypothetical protein